MPFVTSSILAPTSDGLQPTSDVLTCSRFVSLELVGPRRFKELPCSKLQLDFLFFAPPDIPDILARHFQTQQGPQECSAPKALFSKQEAPGSDALCS